MLALSKTSEKHSRARRSLLPFVGNALRFLFGSATTKDLHDVKQKLASTDSQFSKIIRHSLSLLNATHADVKLNRELIQHLQNVSNIYHHQVGALIHDTHNIFAREGAFIHLILRAHDITQLLTHHLTRLICDLQLLVHKLDSCIQGNLPLFIVPLDTMRRALANTPFAH